MIKFESPLGATITLPVTNIQDRAVPQINPEFKDAIRYHLENSIGPYGHKLASEPTGFELHFTLTTYEELTPYQFKITEGKQLVKPPPDLPEGAVS